VPLTPALLRFLTATRRHAGADIEALSFEVRHPVDARLLARALRQVIAHHDALRLRFHRAAEGWHADNAATEEHQVFEAADLSRYGEAEQEAVIAATLADLEARIDLERGPLMQAAFFMRGADWPARFVLLIHHLAVDAYSEPIILRDLEIAYRQLDQGQIPHLPAKTTSFKSWAEQLAAYARSAELQDQLPYWLSLPWGRVRPLPPDLATPDDALGQAAHITVSLGREETSALLYDVAPALGARFSDLLVTALAQGFGAWTGSDVLLLRLISHGREQLFDDVDLSRTVGWLTTAYPVLLSTGGLARPADTVRAVTTYLRRVPAQGIGYGLLRNLGPQALAAQLARLPQPQVHLNYLGQIDQTQGLALFAPWEEPEQPGAQPRVKVFRDVRLKAYIAGGELQLRLGYHDRVYRRQTIADVAQAVLASLRTILVEGRHATSMGATEAARKRRAGHAAA
jgi:non-ribosomal peptide synthase protein (TIGR01720 family)